MEQDNENRQPEQPVENDLFNLTDTESEQPKDVGQAAAPAQDPVSEPEFKVNQEEHPVLMINPAPARPQPGNDPAAAGKEKRQISLRAGTGAPLRDIRSKRSARKTGSAMISSKRWKPTMRTPCRIMSFSGPTCVP